MSSSAFFWSSSVIALSFFRRLNCSIASRRMARTATLASSAFLRTTFVSSLRRSSVRSGSTRRMILPSLEGVRPRSLLRIAFSTAESILVSHREICKRRGSGAEMLAIWVSGVGVP